jgi:prepilin-type N-terminal cleavage/methylation domain-containing protein
MTPLKRQDGFTLIEMMIALLVGALILAGFSEIMMSSLKTERVASFVANMENDAHEMLSRVADELRQTGTGCPNWVLGADTVTYNLCTGSTAGVVSWTTARTLGASYIETGSDDDLDNNGNGLVDERELLLGDAAMGTILTTWDRTLSDPGLSFVLNGNELTITISLTRLHPDGYPMSVTASTVVALRN